VAKRTERTRGAGRRIPVAAGCRTLPPGFGLRRSSGPLSILIGLLALLACGGGGEPVTVEQLRGDWTGHEGRELAIEGTVVDPDSAVEYVTVAPSRYFAVDDGTGTLNVWYNAVKLRCPPREGTTVSVTGTVRKPKNKDFHVFAARWLEVREELPQAEHEVRRCELSYDEQRILAMQGREALREHWKRRGQPERRLASD